MAGVPPKPGQPVGAGQSFPCKDCKKLFETQQELYLHQDSVHPIICPVCKIKSIENTICCDSCDVWYHWLCVGLTHHSVPDEDWYCPSCQHKRRRKSAGKQKRVVPALRKTTSKESIAVPKPPAAQAAPAAPKVPAAQAAPAAPKVPAAQAAPAAPKVPAAQAAPKVPAAQAAPKAPVAQAAPKAPVAQAAPKAPVAQAAPKASVAQAAPKASVAQAAPKAPATQAAPKAPAVLTAPKVPVAQTAPKTSAVVAAVKNLGKATNGVATVKPLPKMHPSSKLTNNAAVQLKAPGPVGKRLSKKSEFSHPTAVRTMKDAKRNLKALQTGSYVCKLCPGERGGPFPCMKASDDHFMEFHWAKRIEFLDSNCQSPINIPCFAKCNDQLREGLGHYHCPACDVCSLSPEAHVKHAAAQHEYSVICAENLDQLQSAALLALQEKEKAEKQAQRPKRNLASTSVALAAQSNVDDSMGIVDHTIGGSSLTDEQIADLIEEDADGRFHCKLCPPSSTLSSQNAAEHHLMNLHMSSHLVIAGRWVCLPCFQDCGPPLHYHCPLCAMTSINMDILLDHTRKHDEYKEAMTELKAKAVSLMQGEEAGGSKPTTTVGKKPTKSHGKKAGSKSTAAAKKTGPDKAAGAGKGPLPKRGVYAGLMVHFNAEETELIVDTAPEQDPKVVEDFFVKVLIPMENTKQIQCKLCPAPDDPCAGFLQPYDTAEAAEQHFLNCHYRFRVRITNIGSCLRCLRSCGKAESDATGHYHCPFCQTLFGDQESFIKHAVSHVAKNGVTKPEDQCEELPLHWAVPPMDAKTWPSVNPAADKISVKSEVPAAPASQKSASDRAVAAGPAVQQPSRVRPAKRPAENTAVVKKTPSNIPVKAEASQKTSQGTKHATGGQMPPPPAPKAMGPPAAPTVKKEAPAVQKDTSAVKEEKPPASTSQPIVTKRGRISKPKPMADSIVSRPFKRTLSGSRISRPGTAEPTNPPQMEAPPRAPSRALTASPGKVRKSDSPRGGRCDPTQKSWFSSPTITALALDRTMGRSKGLYYCGICRDTRYRIRQDVSNHLKEVHVAHSVYIWNKWTVVPCLYECAGTDRAPHYHCPACLSISMSKDDFIRHARTHDGTVEAQPVPEPVRAPVVRPPVAPSPVAPAPVALPPVVRPRASSSRGHDATDLALNLKASEIAFFDEEMGSRCKFCSWSSSVGRRTLEEHLAKHVALGFTVENQFSLPCYRQCSPGLPLCTVHYHCHYCDYMVMGTRNLDKQDDVVALECFLAHCEQVHQDREKPKTLAALTPCKVFNDLQGKTTKGHDISRAIREELQHHAGFDVNKPRTIAREVICLMRPTPHSRVRDSHLFINVKLDMIESSNKSEIDAYILGALSGFYVDFAFCFLCPPGSVLDENVVEHVVKEHMGEIIVIRGPPRDVIVDDWKDEYTQYRPRWLCLRCDCREGDVLGRPHFVCPICQCIMFDKEEFVSHATVHHRAIVEHGIEESEAFGSNGNEGLRRKFFADGYRVRDLSPDKSPNKVSTGFQLASPTAFRKVEDDLASLVVLSGGDASLCANRSCRGTKEGKHYHCVLCAGGDVYPDMARLKAHSFTCPGSPSIALRSNAVVLLEYQENRVLCKLCKPVDGMAWTKSDEIEARAHVSRFHLKEGVIHHDRVYPLCRLDCLLVYGKLVNHFHCYGCGLVFVTGSDLRDHLASCPGTVAAVVNGQAVAAASYEPPEKRRKIEFGMINGIECESETEEEPSACVVIREVEIPGVGLDEPLCLDSAPVAEEEVVAELDLSTAPSIAADESFVAAGEITVGDFDLSVETAQTPEREVDVTLESVADVPADVTEVFVEAAENFPAESERMEEVMEASAVEEPMDTEDGTQDGDDPNMSDMSERVEESMAVDEKCEAMDETEKEDEAMETKEGKPDDTVVSPPEASEQSVGSLEETKEEISILCVEGDAGKVAAKGEESFEQAEPTILVLEESQTEAPADESLVEVHALVEIPALVTEEKRAIEYDPVEAVSAVPEVCEAESLGGGESGQVKAEEIFAETAAEEGVAEEVAGVVMEEEIEAVADEEAGVVLEDVEVGEEATGATMEVDEESVAEEEKVEDMEDQAEGVAVGGVSPIVEEELATGEEVGDTVEDEEKKGTSEEEAAGVDMQVEEELAAGKEVGDTVEDEEEKGTSEEAAAGVDIQVEEELAAGKEVGDTGEDGEKKRTSEGEAAGVDMQGEETTTVEEEHVMAMGEEKEGVAEETVPPASSPSRSDIASTSTSTSSTTQAIEEGVTAGGEERAVVEEVKDGVEDKEMVVGNTSADKPSIFDIDDDLEEPKVESIEEVAPAEVAEIPHHIAEAVFNDFATPSPLGAAGNEAAETLISLGRKRDLAETPQQQPRQAGGVNGEDSNPETFFTPGSVRKVPVAEFVTARASFSDQGHVDFAEMAPARLVFDAAEEAESGT